MRYFKDENNKMYAYEDNVDKKYLKEGLTEITPLQYESFQLFGVFDKTKKEVEIAKKQKQIKDVKQKKLIQLKSDFNTLRNHTAHIISQVIKKPVNARQQDIINIDSLISVLPDNTTKIEFRCYDNSFIEATKTQLEAIKKEIIKAGMETYKKKWLLEQKIEKAQTVADLEKIKWDSDLNEVDSA